MNETINCELCNKDITKKKKDNHHIDYENNITILLCFQCHQLMHGRPVFQNTWIQQYGKDKGFYKLAKKYIQVYEEKICKKET